MNGTNYSVSNNCVNASSMNICFKIKLTYICQGYT